MGVLRVTSDAYSEQVYGFVKTAAAKVILL